MKRLGLSLLAATALLLSAGQPAHAYVGPGAGLSAIGTVIALIGAMLLAVVGFVWYPLKRLLARFKGPAEPGAAPEAPDAGGGDEAP